MGIPAVVGTKTATLEIFNHGDLIIVDGIKGRSNILIQQSEIIAKYEEKHRSI